MHASRTHEDYLTSSMRRGGKLSQAPQPRQCQEKDEARKPQFEHWYFVKRRPWRCRSVARSFVSSSSGRYF